MRDLSGGFDTTDASRLATENRPTPDSRGVISYPNFQVAVAERGETVADIANRLSLSPSELARYNGLAPESRLRGGEVVALPGRVAPGTGGNVDIASLANGALDRADGGPRVITGSPVTTTTLDAAPAAAAPAPAAVPAGSEPARHRVVRGETAYSIARTYNVSVRALADWNGLGTDMNVREGQMLLIPVASAEQPKDPTSNIDMTSVPGQGSTAPEPPSASQPLPDDTKVASATPPPSPNLSEDRSPASAARLLMPVQGSVIRAYAKGKNDGIDISAPAGTPVKAAADATVAAITRDTDQVPILVLRHADNVLTVYANIEDITLKKGDRVTRGQTIAKVRNSNPSFLHFEVREGFESVDPLPWVN